MARHVGKLFPEEYFLRWKIEILNLLSSGIAFAGYLALKVNIQVYLINRLTMFMKTYVFINAIKGMESKCRLTSFCKYYNV